MIGTAAQVTKAGDDPGLHSKDVRPVVCHLVERLTIGGAQVALQGLAVQLGSSACQHIVCALEGGPLQALLEHQGIPVRCLNLPRRSIVTGPLYVIYTVRVLRALTRVLRRHHVALIHAHLPDAIVVGALAGKLSGTPVVGTYQGLGIWPRNRSKYDPRTMIRKILYRLAGRYSKRTIAVSPPVWSLLCENLGFSPETTVLIPNSIDTDRFRDAVPPPGLARELGMEGSQRAIVCVGRFVVNKGQRVLIQAMPEIIGRCPDAVLLLVGDGPARRELTELTTQLGLDGRVKFLGTRSDVPEILSSAEIFAQPSFYEGIPLSVLEAMAAGKPVVATRVPGNADVIEDKRNGILVPPGDPGAMADAIASLLSEPERAKAMGARGQASVRETYDIRETAARVEDLYLDVLGSHRSLPPRERI